MLSSTYNLTNDGVTLTTYILDSSPEMKYLDIRPAILLCPGGGYTMCSDREAESVAMHFLAMGFNVFVLRYSLKENAVFPRPLEDAEEAMDMIVENGELWNTDIKKIAVCGFSAGGHLAAALGTMGKVRPAAVILGYPCITEDICTSKVLYNNVPPLDSAVDENTPPAFIFAASDDTCVPIRSSLDFASALNKAHIPFELHIFSKGEHGFATADYVTCDGKTEMEAHAWIHMCKTWLHSLFFN